MGSRTRTAIPADVADELVQRMAAEKISQSVIRMMRPDSVYLSAVQKFSPEVRYIPVKLPGREVENCYFVPPISDKRPRLSTLKAGWDWSHEAFPDDLQVSA